MKIFKRTNKNKTTIISALISTLILIFSGLSGCDNALEEHLYSSVPVSAFYKNQEEAQLALNGVYNGFWNTIYYDGGWLILNDHTAGTLTSVPNPEAFDTFTWTETSSIFQSVWGDVYEAINRANTLLDKLAEAEDITPEAKMNISGQTKFLRALYYFDLVQLFGGVPLYIHGTTDLSNSDKPRNSTEEVYQQIILDLQDAVQELSPYSESDHSAGKATSGAALSLLSKVYAQRKEWSKAASTAKKVIDMGVFGLNKDYGNIFDPAHSNGKENIFSIQHGITGDDNDKLANHYVYRFGPPPQSINDGTNIEFAHDSGIASQADQSFFDAAPDTYRKWQTMRNKMPYYYIIGSTDLIYNTVALTFPCLVKYYHLNTSTGYLMSNVNNPVIRYSDVLLTYAEALNEVNGGPTQAAYNAINQVRARARGVGTPDEQPESVYPPLSGLSQSQFRNAVLKEEAREFIGEGHRRLDLLRHDMFISDAKSRGINASDKHKLFPIPSEAITKNPNLVQNPGYGD